MDCVLTGLGRIERTAGRVLAGRRDACNTFDAPETVKPELLRVEASGEVFRAELPPCSVAAIEIAVK